MIGRQNSAETAEGIGGTDFITVAIAGQTFGIPVNAVQDVFIPITITKVPLAPPEIAGVLNLRGRIVTAVDLRARLGLPRPEGERSQFAVGLEKGSEAYGILIDEFGDVLSLDPSGFEPNPANLDLRWRAVSRGVYRLDGSLLVVLDVDRILEFERHREVA